MNDSAIASRPNRTIVVLGAAYGGARAAQILTSGLPAGWRVVLVDRNSHANHVYVMPRFAVLPGHEHKAFIPYTNVFMLKGASTPHIHFQAHVTKFSARSIELSKAFPEHGIPTTTLEFDYAVYALGSHLPSPLDLWKSHRQGQGKAPYGGSKLEGMAWLKENQKIVADAPTILVVGGGALGIQFATDIAAVHPKKKVTLLHSRQRLLPRFDEGMHREVLRSLEAADVEIILGERLDLESAKSGKVNDRGQRVVRTMNGREIAADLLLLCTGQTPNTELLKEWDPRTVEPTSSLAHVLPSLQLGVVGEAAGTTPYPHIFAIGDAADAFGAIAAGHTAFNQGEVAARNIIRLIHRESSSADKKKEPLEVYAPSAPAIKVSLGLKHSVYQYMGAVGTSNEGVDDLQASSIWPFFGITPKNDEEMHQ